MLCTRRRKKRQTLSGLSSHHNRYRSLWLAASTCCVWRNLHLGRTKYRTVLTTNVYFQRDDIGIVRRRNNVNAVFVENSRSYLVSIYVLQIWIWYSFSKFVCNLFLFNFDIESRNKFTTQNRLIFDWTRWRTRIQFLYSLKTFKWYNKKPRIDTEKGIFIF